MNIVITGGCGFLGHKLAEKFYHKRHNVTALDIEMSKYSFRRKILKKINYFKADITSLSSLKKIKVKPNSVLLHCAGQPSAAVSFQNPYDDLKKNILGMLNVLNFAKTKKINKIIFASTFNVYMENYATPKLSENSICLPKSLLANSKLAAENYLRIYADHLKIKWNILRMFNVYGPGQDPNNPNLGMVSIFLNMAKNNPEIKVKGSTKRFRDFIYIDDVVDAWYKMTKDKKNYNKIYNLGSGTKTTLDDLFLVISKSLNKKIKIKVEKGTPGDFLGCYADISKISKDLKFKPNVNLGNGIIKFNNWLSENK